ncbi:TPA: conserved hypothetical protein [Aquificae Joseph's Coat Spring virus]|nr:TPA: conserved hypothetical protein [Aquificae Joseph's Coat Spring virus]
MGLLNAIENVAKKVTPKIEEGLAPILPIEMTLGNTLAHAEGKTPTAHNQAKAFLQSGVGHWFLSTPKIATELADKVYSTITGKDPHLLVKTNDMVKQLIGTKLYTNLPTTDEVYNHPERALNTALTNNDAHAINTILQLASKNPQTYHRAIVYLTNHTINDFIAVNSGKADTKTQSLLANEYNILNQLAVSNQLPENLRQPILERLKAMQDPIYHTAIQSISHYQTINKAIDIINGVGLAASIFGGIGGKIADEGLAFAVSKLLETGGAVMMGTGTLVDAHYNAKPLSHVLSPVNIGIFGDVIRGIKELPETLQTEKALKALKDPNFNITDWVTNFYNPKTNQADLDKLNAALRTVSKTDEANFTWHENFIKNLNKVIGDKLGAILDGVLSDYKKEQMLVKDAKSFIEGFYKSDVVKDFYKPYIKADGSVKIDDANEVEERLLQEAKNHPEIANFVKMVRQTRFVSAFRQAIDYGNKDIQVFIHDLGNEEEPVKHFLYQSTQSLESMINELEPYWEKGNNVVVKYMNKEGNLISRTIKATYHPTYDEFRIVRGVWRVLDHDGEWKDIEDDINIPVHRIGDIKGAVEDVLRSKYQNVDLSKSTINEILKPASNIFPYKLNRIADRLVRLQTRLEKKAFAEFNKHADILNDLKDTAIKINFLTEDEAKQIEDPRDLFQLLKQRIKNARKDSLRRIEPIKEGIQRVKNRLEDTADYLHSHSNYENLLNKFENKLNKVEQTYWGIFKNQKEEKMYRDFVEQARNLGILPTHKSVEDYLKQPSVEVLEQAKNNLAKLYDEYIDTTKDMKNYAEKVLVDETNSLTKLIKLKPITDTENFSHMQKLINKLFISNKDYLRSEEGLMTAIGKEGSHIREIAETIQKLAKTSASDMRREGSGFAKVFNSYEDFADYGTLKYLSPILSNFKSMNFLSKLNDDLEEAEKKGGLNETQKVIKNFIKMVLYKDPNDVGKAQRLLGSLMTALSVPISLSLSITGFKNAHILFPSLDIAKMGEVDTAWLKEYKKFIYGQGIYKINAFNPLTSFPYAVLKGHILSNLKDDNIFNNVIKDYAKYVGLDNETGINMLKEIYKDDREKFAETLSEIATGSDPKSLLPVFVKYSKIGETGMPWYRYITAPFSIGVETYKRWGNLPDYIEEHGIGKAIAKPLALGLFTTALLGTQSSMIVGPAQTAYNFLQSGVSVFAPFFGINHELLPQESIVSLIGGEIGHEFNINLLDPEEKTNFYTKFGTSFLRMIAAATGTHLDTTTAGKWLATGLNIFTNLGSVDALSPSAGSYAANIPVPALSLIKNIMRPIILDKTESQKYLDVATEVARSMPAINNLYKDIVGQTVATHMGTKGHTNIYEPSVAQQLLTPHAQGFIGLLHTIGFIALSGFDGVLNSNEANKVVRLIQYEINPNKYTSPVHDADIPYNPILNGRDYTIGLKPLPDLIGTLNSLTPAQKQLVVKRFYNVLNTNIAKMNKLFEKPTLTPHEEKELLQRYTSLQNMAIALINTHSIDNELGTELRQIYNEAYQALQKRHINVNYNEMLREKRKLKP